MCADRTLFEHPKSPPTHWSNEQLDELRLVTDEPADDLIAEFFERENAEPHELLMTIMAHRVNRPIPTATNPESVSIPHQLLDELARRCPPPTVDPAEVRHGEQLFQGHGPEMLLGLACYSLPMAYSAANGARVLHETGYLENRVARRLVETTQMVIDVMKPGGLAPGGDGVRTAHEIRLLHAAIRYLINHRDSDWDPAWGHPINQEDMAGTLMTFSYVILDGLSKIGINIDRPAQEAYLAAWRAVGQVMGVKEELLPANMELAQELTWFIFDRQGRGSPQGIDLTRALLDTMQSLAPFFMKPFCSSLLRVYVEKDVADYLKVPRHLLRDSLTLGLQRAYGAIDNLLHLSPFGLWGYRLLSHFVIDILTHLGRGDHKQAAFTIPEELHAHWKRWTPG